MSIIDDLVSGVKNNLRWQAQSAVTSSMDKGVRTVVKNFKNRCPKCGKAVKEEGARFCPNCQAKLVLICPNSNCGRELPLKTKFCPSCGSSLK
jgi:rRNA maturation endonuclease Nob1